MRGAAEDGRTRELEAEAVQVSDAQDAARVRQAGFLERLVAGVGTRTGTIDGDRRIARQDDVSPEVLRSPRRQAVAIGGEDEAAGRGDGARVIADGEDA